MTSAAQAAAFVDRFARAWAGPDLDQLEALWTDDVVLVQPLGPTTVGRAAGREAFTSLLGLVPDLRATVHRWGATDDGVLIEFTLSGTLGGRELSWSAVDRIVLRDGSIAERRSYFDSIPILRQVLTRPRGWPQLASTLRRTG
jgi:ketosteroid isomerase-like protein